MQAGELQRQVQAHRERQARLNGHIPDSPKLDTTTNLERDYKIKKLEERCRILEMGLADAHKRFALLQLEITKKLKRNAVADDEPAEDNRPSVKQIKEAVRRYFELTPVDLDSLSRTADITYPRQIVMYLARNLTLRSFPEIGRLLGRRDHTTILHGHRKIEHRIKSNWTVAYDVAMIERML